MNSRSVSTSPESGRHRWRRVLLAGMIGAAALIAIVWLRPRGPLPPAIAEVSRDQLVLHDDGRMYHTNATTPFTGVMRDVHPDGTLKSRSCLADGRLEGLSEGWHTNGVKQIEEHFHAGVSHGLRTKWHENGRKLSEGQIVEGRLDGVFRRWHADGTLAEEIPMAAGQPNGLSRAFYPSGCLKAEAHLKAGQVIDQKHWQDGEMPGGISIQSTTPELSSHP